jgi:hypothetical protein
MDLLVCSLPHPPTVTLPHQPPSPRHLGHPSRHLIVGHPSRNLILGHSPPLRTTAGSLTPIVGLALLECIEVDGRETVVLLGEPEQREVDDGVVHHADIQFYHLAIVVPNLGHTA